jgi:hypothetical protein
MCLWFPLIHSFQGGVHYADDGTRTYLTVEAMPSGTQWEWLAWVGRSPARCRHGYASSAASARRLAEDAAIALDRRSVRASAAALDGAETGHAGEMPADRRRTAQRQRAVRQPGRAATVPGSAPGRTLRPPQR